MIALALPWLLRAARGVFGRLSALSPVGLLSLALGVGLALALGLGGVLWFRLASAQRSVATLEAEQARLTLSLDAQSRALLARDAALAVLSEEAMAAAERLRALQQARQEIQDAPSEDDGPVAPVLGRALERLRQTRP